MRWARRSTEEEELGAVVVYSFDPLRSEHGDGRIFGVDGKSSARFADGQSLGVLICGAEKRIVGKQSRGTVPLILLAPTATQIIVGKIQRLFSLLTPHQSSSENRRRNAFHT